MGLDSEADAVMLRKTEDGTLSRPLLEDEEELLDAWLAEIYRPDATDAVQAVFEMAANGIPMSDRVKLHIGGKDLNNGPDTEGANKPKVAAVAGVSVSF